MPNFIANACTGLVSVWITWGQISPSVYKNLDFIDKISKI